MKDAVETTPNRASEDTFTNRKLIRPTLAREGRSEAPAERRERPAAAAASSKKTPPPEQTHAENFYYQKQMQAKTPMVVVLRDGEELHGIIEWYDRTCIKLTRTGSPNLLVYKSFIKYLYKEAEG
jgi:host factor-I protein